MKTNTMTIKRRGQGMTEYIIIVALIAIGAIAAMTIFGDNIRALFGMSTQALQGTAATDTRAARNTGKEVKTLKNFGQ